jgi:superfamily II DNA or RNA helicase
MRRAIIRRIGPAISISIDGVRPLARWAYEELEAVMSYRQVTHLYGKDVLVHTDPDTGKKTITRLLIEDKRLYRYDDRGRMMCGAGYIDRAYSMLRAQDRDVAIVDETEWPEGDKLRPSWDKLAKRPEFTPTEADKALLKKLLITNQPVPTDLARRVKQDEMIRAVAARIAKKYGGVVQAPPGFGKTHAYKALCILFRGAKIAVVTPGQDNFFKTVKALTIALPSIGEQGHGKSSEGRITVYSLQSAHHIPDDVDLLLVDEGHEALAAKSSGVLSTVAPKAIRITTTATPTGRGDGTDARMEGMFGKIIWKMEWPEAVRLGLVVPIEVRWLDCNFLDNPAEGKSGIWRSKAGIWEHDARNAVIASAARKHKDDQVLIMVDKIEHALRLKQLLPDYSLVYGSQDIDYFEKFAKKGLIDADFTPVSPKAREDMRLAFEAGELKHAIATDVWARGVSFDALQVLIRGDGRSSTIMDEQIPGRVSRTDASSGKSVGILYDCNDMFDPTLRGKAAARRKNYKEKEWVQIDPPRRSRLAS